MKRLYITCISISTAIMLLLPIWSGCDEGPNDDWKRITGSSESPYLFSGIITPTKIGIVDTRIKLKSPYGGITIELYGPYYHQHVSTEMDAKFKELAFQLGDIPSGKPYYHIGPADHVTSSADITGLKVKALSNYNDTYPEGSILTDIILASYSSFDSVILRASSPEIFGSHCFRTVKDSKVKDEIFPIKVPALLRLMHDLNHRTNASAEFMRLNFKEKPNTPEQTLEVTLNLSDGTQLKDTAVVSIN